MDVRVARPSSTRSVPSTARNPFRPPENFTTAPPWIWRLVPAGTLLPGETWYTIPV
jgi:hypothetical protein